MLLLCVPTLKQTVEFYHWRAAWVSLGHSILVRPVVVAVLNYSTGLPLKHPNWVFQRALLYRNEKCNSALWLEWKLFHTWSTVPGEWTEIWEQHRSAFQPLLFIFNKRTFPCHLKVPCRKFFWGGERIHSNSPVPYRCCTNITWTMFSGNVCHTLSPSWQCHVDSALMPMLQGSNAKLVLAKQHWYSPSQ